MEAGENPAQAYPYCKRLQNPHNAIVVYDMMRRRGFWLCRKSGYLSEGGMNRFLGGDIELFFVVLSQNLSRNSGEIFIMLKEAKK